MCFSLRPKASKHNIYILQSRLRGHSGAIARLRATEDGRFLASGGTDGTKVWDLNTMHELGSPKTPESRGATTALGLAVFEELYCERLVNPAKLPAWRSTLPPVALQCAIEAAWFSHTLRGSNGKATGDLWTIGALIHSQRVLCMDEPSSGTNLYRLEDHTCVKTFPVSVTKQQRLRQVDFLDECGFILSGSDHGVVYVFDRRSGDIVEELRVDPHEWVQTVAAADCAGVATIFAAKSAIWSAGTDIVAEGAADIQHQQARPTSTGKGLGVWVYNAPQHPPPLPTYNVGQWWKRDLADLVIVRCDDVTMVTITTQIIAYHHDRRDRHIGLGGSSTPLPSPSTTARRSLRHSSSVRPYSRTLLDWNYELTLLPLCLARLAQF
ncbi:hypothetical protein B0H10DRAFT_2217827 [Mycena sp. CBHHK59/15]|nr:hypothetical protein B0H10DRAFT_2217827 [Mycena sp. CBHHK59/15]